jgi:hypothetical protein
MKKLNPAFPITVSIFAVSSIILLSIIKKYPENIKDVFSKDSLTIYIPPKIFLDTTVGEVPVLSLSSRELVEKLLGRKYNKNDSLADEAQKIIDLRILRKAIIWDYLPEGSTTDDLTVHIRQLMSKDGMLDDSL